MFRLTTTITGELNGRIIPKEFTEEVARHFRASDKPLVLTAVEQRKVKSLSQNAHLNGHVQQISDVTGQDFNDVKKYVKQQAVKKGYPVKQDDSGFPMVDLWGDSLPISEADCTPEQCSLLIDEVHILASELGVVLKEN